MPRRLTNAERLREADRLSEALEQLVDVSTAQRAYVEGVIAGLRGEVPDSLTRRQR